MKRVQKSCVQNNAFNALQAQLRNFVDDRTLMLAAISHDLRTPLTKIRPRGEFIEDKEERLRLFRDVDDLQAMADSALSLIKVVQRKAVEIQGTKAMAISPRSSMPR